MHPYVSPEYEKDSFHCPHCNSYARQNWNKFRINSDYRGGGLYTKVDVAECFHCGDISIWYDGKLLYPDDSGIELPNQDLNEDIKKDYLEARNILNKSPRGAAALLRLSIQKLCKQLGEKGENINSDIASLVKKGLPKQIQQALDVVRVIGNNAVHPGVIELDDNIETATKLFELVNIIAQIMITQPKEIENLYDSLPDSTKEAINKRDAK